MMALSLQRIILAAVLFTASPSISLAFPPYSPIKFPEPPSIDGIDFGDFAQDLIGPTLAGILGGENICIALVAAVFGKWDIDYFPIELLPEFPMPDLSWIPTEGIPGFFGDGTRFLPGFENTEYGGGGGGTPIAVGGVVEIPCPPGAPPNMVCECPVGESCTIGLPTTGKSAPAPRMPTEVFVPRGPGLWEPDSEQTEGFWHEQ